MNKSKFVIKPTKGCKLRGCKAADEWYFVLVASNGKVVATSEVYNRRRSAQDGIKAVKNAVPWAVIEIDKGDGDEQD